MSMSGADDRVVSSADDRAVSSADDRVASGADDRVTCSADDRVTRSDDVCVASSAADCVMSSAADRGTDDRALAAVAARWLTAASGVAGALGMTAAALAAVLLAWRAPLPPAAAAALLLAAAERVLALRCRFDAGLFDDIAQGRLTPATLDASLAVMGLRAASTTPRPLAPRVQGAQRLVRWHAAVAAVQFGCVVGAAWGAA